jgi:hypothetical protein
LTFETDRKSKSVEATKDRKIEQLESKLQRKKRGARRVDGGARAAKKRTWGALSNRWAPHETRDELVDFVRHWGEKSEIPNCRLLGWIGIRLPTTRTMPAPRINLGHEPLLLRE